MRRMIYSLSYLELLDSLKKINAVLSLSPSPKPEVIIDSLMRLSQILSVNDEYREFLYDYFCENNLFGKVANLVSNDDKNIKVQMLQTISIIIKNQTSNIWLYYIFGNKGLDRIVNDQHLYEDDDLVAWASSLLKMLSFLLDGTTIKFFINPVKNDGEFPLFTQTLKLINHYDSMVRSHARICTLNILRVKDTLIDNFISHNIQTFYVLPNYLFECWETINDKVDINSMSNMSGVAASLIEAEDYLLYLNDLFSIDFTKSKHLLNYIKNECFDKLIDIINMPFTETYHTSRDNIILLDNMHLSDEASKFKKDARSHTINLTLDTGTTYNMSDIVHEVIQANTPSSISSLFLPPSAGDELLPCDESTYRDSYTPEDLTIEEHTSDVKRTFHPLTAAYIFTQILKMEKDKKCTNLSQCFEDLRGVKFFNKIRPFLNQIFASKYESVDSSLLILLEFINAKIDEIAANELEQIILIFVNMWKLVSDIMDWNNLTNIKLRIITLRNLTSLTLQLNAVNRIISLIPHVKMEEVFLFEHLSIIWDEWMIFKSTCDSHCNIGYQALFIPRFRTFGSIMIQFGKKVDLEVEGVRTSNFIPPYYLLPASPVDIFRYSLQVALLFSMLKKLAYKLSSLKQIFECCPLVMDNWNIGFMFGGNLKISPPNLSPSKILRLGDKINLSNSIICRLDTKTKTYRYFIANDMLFILASSDKQSRTEFDGLSSEEDAWGEITCLHPLWNITIKEFGKNSLTARILSTPGTSPKLTQKRQKYYDRERITGTTGCPPALVKYQLILHFDELESRDQMIQHVSKAYDRLIENCQESFNFYMNCEAIIE